MHDRDKEKQTLNEMYLYGLVTLGIAWVLMFLIIGIDFLINKLWQ